MEIENRECTEENERYVRVFFLDAMINPASLGNAAGIHSVNNSKVIFIELFLFRPHRLFTLL
jgi:hypothetical protein